MSTKASPEPVAWLRGHRSSVSCLAFLHTTMLVSGDIEGDLILWDLPSKRIKHHLKESHEGGVLQVCTKPTTDSSNVLWLSQGRMDGNLKIWHGDALMNVVRLQTESFCKAFAVFTDGDADPFTLACTKSSDASVAVVWNSQLQMRQPQYELHATVADGAAKTGMVMAVELVHFNEYAVIAYEDGYLRVFRLENQQQVGIVCVQADFTPVTSFVYCATTGRGLAAGASSEMTQFQLNFAGDEVKINLMGSIPVLAMASKEEKLGKGVGQIALRPDCRICAVASWDHRLRIFHWQTMKPLAVLKSHRDSVQCVAFSQDSTLLASGSKDRNIAIWSIYTK